MINTTVLLVGGVVIVLANAALWFWLAEAIMRRINPNIYWFDSARISVLGYTISFIVEIGLLAWLVL